MLTAISIFYKIKFISGQFVTEQAGLRIYSANREKMWWQQASALAEG